MGVKIEHLCGWGVVLTQFSRGKATFKGHFLPPPKKISVYKHIFIHSHSGHGYHAGHIRLFSLRTLFVEANYQT